MTALCYGMGSNDRMTAWTMFWKKEMVRESLQLSLVPDQPAALLDVGALRNAAGRDNFWWGRRRAQNLNASLDFPCGDPRVREMMWRI